MKVGFVCVYNVFLFKSVTYSSSTFYIFTSKKKEEECLLFSAPNVTHTHTH
jgi:hypothetical protein